MTKSESCIAQYKAEKEWLEDWLSYYLEIMSAFDKEQMDAISGCAAMIRYLDSLSRITDGKDKW